MRMIKMLGIALVAMAALSAAGASAASAAQFQASAYPNQYLGYDLSQPAWSFDNLDLTCQKGNYQSNELAGPASSVTLTASAPECASNLDGPSWSTTVSLNGCKYELLQPSGTGPYSGSLGVKCPLGSAIVVRSSGGKFGTCEVKVGSQTIGGSPVAYVNGASSFQASVNTAAVTYTKTVDSGLCPMKGTGEVVAGGSLSLSASFYGTGGARAFVG